MKNKFTILSALVFILVLNTTSFAQTVTAKWGPIQKTKRNSDVAKVIGRDQSGFYVLESTIKVFASNKLYIKKFDNENTEIFKKELSIESANGHKVLLEDVIMIDNQMILFTSYYDKKEDKNIAYVTKINSNGEVEGDTRQIDEIAATKKKNAGAFHFLRSGDSTKILVYHNEAHNKKDKNAEERYAIKVIDKNLTVLWGKTCSAPYKDKDFTISDYTLSNDNKVYMLAKIQEGKKSKKDGKPNYKFSILGYSGSGSGKSDVSDDEEDGASDAEEYVVSLGEKFITQISFELDKSNNLICAGFYSNNNNLDMAGVFFLKIDSKTKNVLQKNIKYFNKDVLSMFMSSRKASKGKELYDYKLRSLIPKKSGGSYLIAEQYQFYITQSTDSKGRTTSTDYHYLYNDVFVVNILASGDIGWVCHVPKFQHTVNDNGYYSSFATLSLEKEEKLCLIYNDNKKNLEITDDKKIKSMGNLKKTIVTMVVIDNQGNYVKAALLNNKEDKVLIRPKMNLQVESNEIILYGKRGKKYRFGTIKVE